jgi:4-amino-4-deoxy-L-arabinose transferase-like glycosyltransferase
VIPILLGTVLLPRLILFALNENLFGDAVSRTELAAEWAAHPHWIASFADGARQYGPLHLYLLGVALRLWPAQEHAGRLVGLIFGTLAVLPLYALTRRLFGWRAAVWAVLGLGAWGVHLQFSTTAASEALSLFLVLWALSLFAAGVDEKRFAPIIYSALVLNLACATRYDSWLLIPLLGVVLLFEDKDRVAAVTRASFFVLFCLPFPMIWMQGNEAALGHPFAPIRYIEEFHRSWVLSDLARWGPVLYRLQNLLFWPGTALLTLTPLVALFGIAGMVYAWRERPNQRWLLWVAWIPSAYFTFRAALLVNFQPLARFAASQVALLLPYVYLGFSRLFGRAGAWIQTGVAALAVGLAIAGPIALGVFTFRADGKWQDWVRPISPITTNSEPVRRVAGFIKEEIGPRNAAIILDEDPNYSDLQIAFFGGLPEERMARYRWREHHGDERDRNNFPERLRSADPEYLLRIDGGRLTEHPEIEVMEGQVRLGNRWFNELPGFGSGYHLYRRR